MIILSKSTEKNIMRVIENPTHAIMLSGPEGAGKLHTAKFVAARLLKIDDDRLKHYAYFRIISPEDNLISIDQIRQLQKFLYLKTTGKNNIRRVIIIQDAHLMNVESQNALLKSLEEPPEDTVILLTTHNNYSLKETIYSRVIKVPITSLPKEQLRDLVSNKLINNEIDRFYNMSGGLPGLFYSLANQESRDMIDSIQLAKKVLASSTYDRLLMVDGIAKQKELIPQLLQAIKIISSTALEQSAGNTNQKMTNKWYKILQSTYNSESYLPNNPNAKLLLTNLFLSF